MKNLPTQNSGSYNMPEFSTIFNSKNWPTRENHYYQKFISANHLVAHMSCLKSILKPFLILVASWLWPSSLRWIKTRKGFLQKIDFVFQASMRKFWPVCCDGIVARLGRLTYRPKGATTPPGAVFAGCQKNEKLDSCQFCGGLTCPQSHLHSLKNSFK